LPDHTKILHSGLKNIENITSGDVLLIKRNIHNSQSSKLPKLPTTLTKIHGTLKNMKFKTVTHENFLLVNNNETNNIFVKRNIGIHFNIKIKGCN